MKPQFDLYFAGYYTDEMEDILMAHNYNKLLSNINERKGIARYIEAKKEGRFNGKLLIDSGAFSVHKSGKTVDVEDYINFLNENHEYLDHYIQLDDIPGKWGVPRTKEEVAASPIKTWNNYLYMRSKLIEPDKLLPVFHQGEDFKYLKQMLEYKDADGEKIKYMCISSNKDLDARKRYDWYLKCYEVIETSSNPDIKIHSLGTQSERHCQMLPFTSVDATSWIMTAANGNIYSKWGSVTISDRQLGNNSNIVNKVSYNIFRKYLEDNCFSLEELQSSSAKRIEWNLLYLGNWAKNIREYKGPKTFIRRRLF